MPDEIRLTIQVVVSLLIIFGVLWWMWRIPGEAIRGSVAAAMLAFVSVWFGVAAIVAAAWLWWTSVPQFWAITTVLIWAAAISTGLLALWTYRHTPPDQMLAEVHLQRAQARVGVALGLVAVTMWYIYMITRFSGLPIQEPGEPAAGLGAHVAPLRTAENEALRTYNPWS